MVITRREFVKRVGGGAAALVAAPALLESHGIQPEGPFLELRRTGPRVKVIGVGEVGERIVGRWKGDRLPGPAHADVDLVLLVAGTDDRAAAGEMRRVGRLAREAGALTLGIVPPPSARRGALRGETGPVRRAARDALLDTTIVVSDAGPALAAGSTPTDPSSSDQVDRSVLETVRSVVVPILRPGSICIGFADIRCVFEGGGDAVVAHGVGEGRHAHQEAATRLLQHPTVRRGTLGRFRRALLSIATGQELSVDGVREIQGALYDGGLPDVPLALADRRDPDLIDGCRITLIGVGVDARPPGARARLGGGSYRG